MFDSTVYEVPDSRDIFFLSSVYITTVLICAAVNWVFCFAYILIVAFLAFDQKYDVLVWHVVRPACMFLP